MRKIIEDYFTLPRWERWAIVGLVIINIGFIVWFNVGSSSGVSEEELNQLEKNYASLSSQRKKKPKPQHQQSAIQGQSSSSQSQITNPESQISYFNPNHVNKQFLITAGVSKSVASRWEKYLAKGGKFKKAEDVRKLYGMDSATFNRLKPYMQLDVDSAKAIKTSTPLEIIDLNTADTARLNALPGIGLSTSKNIVNYRNALGGFHSISQLKELKSVREENYAKMIAYMDITTPHSKININTVTAAVLDKHPYFRNGLAGSLVAYREKHGAFKNENDLKKCALITEEVLVKIRPYMVFE
jgi:competence protein ComEA